MKFLEIGIILFSAIFIYEFDSAHGSAGEKQLLRHLLNDLEIGERPVENHKDNVTVTIGLTMMRVDDVVDDMHHVELTAWLTLKWVAYNLRWEPSEFENINDTRIHPSKIWTPDIFSYTSIAESMDRFHQTHVVVRSNGTVHYIPPGQMTNPCLLSEGSSYPFEKLICNLKFGSWVHSGEQIDLQLEPGSTGASLSSLVQHPEWKVLECPGKRTVMHYTCCTEPYIDVAFALTLQRRGEAILAEAKSFSCFALGLLFMSCLLGSKSAFKVLLALVPMLMCIYFSNRFDPKLGTAEPTELAKYFVRLSYLGFFILFTNLLAHHFYTKVGSVPDKVKQLMDKFPQYGPFRLRTPRPEVASSTLPSFTHNYNDLQELTLSEGQSDTSKRQELGDWQELSLLVDKLFFIIWTIVLIIFDLMAFPSYDI